MHCIANVFYGCQTLTPSAISLKSKTKISYITIVKIREVVHNIAQFTKLIYAISDLKPYKNLFVDIIKLNITRRLASLNRSCTTVYTITLHCKTSVDFIFHVVYHKVCSSGICSVWYSTFALKSFNTYYILNTIYLI